MVDPFWKITRQLLKKKSKRATTLQHSNCIHEYLSHRNVDICSQKPCMLMLTVALFAIAPNKKQQVNC